MAIKQINIVNISTKAYARQMIADFLESDWDAAAVEVMEGMTEDALNTQLRNVIAEQEIKDKVVCQKKDGMIRLIKAELV